MKLNLFKKIRIKTAAITGIVLLLAYIFYFLIIPEMINIDKYRYLIITQSAKNLQLPMEIGPSKATMTWNWGIIVHSKNLTIKHSDNTKYISTGPVDIEISIPYILRHQIRVRNINVQNSEILVSRLEDGSFDIEQLISEKYKKFIKYKTIFKDANINLENYKIYFSDKFIPVNKNYLIFGDNFKISDFAPKKAINIEASGKILNLKRPDTSFNIKYSGALPVNTKDILKNDILLTGQVKDFYPDMFAPYLKHIPYYYIFKHITGSDFKINLHKDESEIDEISLSGNFQDISTQNKKLKLELPFSQKTRISITAQKKGQNILIKDANIKNNDIDITILGNIYNETAKNSDLDLSLAINNSKLESIYSLLPNKPFPFNLTDEFKKYKVKGILSANMDIKGNPKAPDILGALEFKNISLTRNSTTIKNTKGKIIFNKKEYNINANTLLDKNSYIQLSGYIAPQTNKINLDIKSNNISLMPAQQLFLTIADITNLKAGAIKRTNMKGRGNVNLNISGEIKTPDINGNLSFINTQIQYKGLSQPLENLSGQVKFLDKNIVYANLKAKFAKNPVNITGRRLKNKTELILASKKINIEALRNLILSSPDLKITGNVVGALGKFSGLADTHLSFEGDKNNNLVFKKLNLKLFENNTAYQDIPINLNSGKVTFTPEKTTLKTLSGKIGNSHITLDGEILNTQSSSKMKLLVKSKVDSNDIYYYLNPRLIAPLEAKGIFSVTAVITGMPQDWKLSAQALLNKGDYIYLRQTPLPFDKSRTVNIKLFGRAGAIAVDEVQIAAKNSPEISAKFICPYPIQAPIVVGSKHTFATHNFKTCTWNFACQSPQTLSGMYQLHWVEH